MPSEGEEEGGGEGRGGCLKLILLLFFLARPANLASLHSPAVQLVQSEPDPYLPAGHPDEHV